MLTVIRDFFLPDAKVELVGDLLTATLPDGRSFTITIGAFEYHNPKAERLPPFDFRDHLGKPDEGSR